MRVCVGGTFDRLHAAHRALIEAAFFAGAGNNEVFIGLSTDALSRAKPGIQPFGVRRKALLRFLGSGKFKKYQIIPLTKKMGIAHAADLDAIVVSEETQPGAGRINAARRKAGRKPLQVIVVEKVYADDLVPISSTRIRAGEIDTEGRRLRPLRVIVGSANGVKVQAVRNVIAQIFGRLRAKQRFAWSVRGFSAGSGVGEQPKGNETVEGAIRRARKAVESGDIGIGIEAGLFWNKTNGRYHDVQHCAVVDSTGWLTLGHGSGFAYPLRIHAHLHEGKTVSEAFLQLHGIDEIGRREGAIGFLTGGLLTREELTRQCVFAALVPRISGRAGALGPAGRN